MVNLTDQDDCMVPRVVKVSTRRKEINNTWTLELKDDLLSPAPGQFYMLYVMNVGEVPISVSGIPKHGRLVHTIRGVGNISNAITGLKKGDSIGLRGPFGTAWPLEVARKKDVVVMAGGLGLAPLRPLIHYFINNPSACRSLTVFYGARGPEEILYHEELESWRTFPHTRVEITVDHATYNWRGNVGVVTKLLKPGQFKPKKTVAYVCGPEVMMKFCARQMLELGINKESIFLSMERNMKCAIGHCGHCQFGKDFICKDGPIFPYDQIESRLNIREL
ncbi:MAG: FAD/NAD(P)-binding protein [Gammaproteobacteria bacterium]|nr:FAD/NAD(P)-binding protein [Gammaproteobacteria bacterium]